MVGQMLWKGERDGSVTARGAGVVRLRNYYPYVCIIQAWAFLLLLA